MRIKAHAVQWLHQPDEENPSTFDRMLTSLIDDLLRA
jgi:hypothetical protein